MVAENIGVLDLQEYRLYIEMRFKGSNKPNLKSLGLNGVVIPFLWFMGLNGLKMDWLFKV